MLNKYFIETPQRRYELGGNVTNSKQRPAHFHLCNPIIFCNFAAEKNREWHSSHAIPCKRLSNSKEELLKFYTFQWACLMSTKAKTYHISKPLLSRKAAEKGEMKNYVRMNFSSFLFLP